MSEYRSVGRWTFLNPPEAIARVTPRAMKAAWKRVGVYWHRKMMPRHFDAGAGNVYKYQPRSNDYMRRKQRRWGHRRPLWWTGAMKQKVSAAPRVTSTAKYAKVALRGPRYLYMYRRDYNQPDKAAELTRTIQREQAELRDILERRVKQRFEGLRIVKRARSK